MNIQFDREQDGNIRKIVAAVDGHRLAEYCMETVDALSGVGERLLDTTLTLWGLLDFCLSDENRIGFSLTADEEDYIRNTYRYCTTLYTENYSIPVAEVAFAEQAEKIRFVTRPMTDQYYLGYTGGKDSTLCKLLLEDLGKDIVYYSVSYDDDAVRGEGRIFCRICDQALYDRYTITGYKATSDLISFQQADDIHVTFIAPYLYGHAQYPANLAVGLPYDAVHTFASGVADLVPTETLKSIEYLERLMHSYGYTQYRVVSPVASLHTFGIYCLLEKIIGLDALMKLDSCWETTAEKTEPCGMCPKCQRLKYVFRNCFSMDYLPEVPLLNITSADFLFGSIHACQLLRQFSPEQVGSHQFLHIGTRTETEFVEHIQRKYGFGCIELPNIDFVKDTQTWSDVLEQIVAVTGVDYRLLKDEWVQHLQMRESVGFLPFEKYYNWGRKYPVLRCYEDVQAVFREVASGKQ